jgi:uncharacterized paraquat-inducible protein A
MVFIVQCPNPNCQAFMLLEDSARGASVPCLRCKKTIQVSSSGSGERSKSAFVPVRSTESPAEEIPIAPRQKVATCPQCNAPLRLPPAAQKQAIKCPRCQKVFVAGG